MVNLKVENEKLRHRAVGIVSEIAGVEQGQAHSALIRSGGDVKIAILMARGVQGRDVAAGLLSNSRGRIPQALASLGHGGFS
jgi:N-acetylmuramic acid 6-phosphate etherase